MSRQARGTAHLLLALLVLCVCTAWAPDARAEGVVVDARPGGLTGPQTDAVVLSAAPRLAPEGTGEIQSYEVQAGDTLTGIAARLGVTLSDLVERNGLSDADHIAQGQILKFGRNAGSLPTLPSRTPLVRAQFWPWPPAQGQSLVVWLRAREAGDISVDFQGKSYPLRAEAGSYSVIIPIPLAAPAGPSAMQIRAAGSAWRVQVPIQTGVFTRQNIPASAASGILSDPLKVRAEAARFNALFAPITVGVWSTRSRFSLPLKDDHPRTAPFGSQRTYGTDPAVSFHTGEDFSALPGTEVYAPADGVVMLAEAVFVRGNAVVIDHGGGVYTGYWHLSELALEAGTRVVQGQLLGKVGSTGLSTGAHLHWEVRVLGVAVDPLQWLTLN